MSKQIKITGDNLQFDVVESDKLGAVASPFVVVHDLNGTQMHLSSAASTVNVNTPVSATAAVISYTAVTSVSHYLTGVAWSYSASPTGGGLTIADGANTVFSIDIPSAGANSVLFNVPLKGTAGSNMVITLASGAGSVVGKVNALGHWAV